MSPDSALPMPRPVKVEQNKDSGSFKVTIPVAKNTATKVGVDPATDTHTVLVETEQETKEDTEPKERRRNPMPTQVVVQQPLPTGGLQGPWATIANMSAVGFVLILSFMMYNDFRSSVKEQNTSLTNEIRLNRESNDRNIVTLNAAISLQTQSTNALMNEVRAGRLTSDAHNAKLEATIDKLTAALEKKKP